MPRFGVRNESIHVRRDEANERTNAQNRTDLRFCECIVVLDLVAGCQNPPKRATDWQEALQHRPGRWRVTIVEFFDKDDACFGHRPQTSVGIQSAQIVEHKLPVVVDVLHKVVAVLVRDDTFVDFEIRRCKKRFFYKFEKLADTLESGTLYKSV